MKTIGYKTSNYAIILISLILHIALVAGVIFIKPTDKTKKKQKSFDLVELNMGKPQAVPQHLSQTQQPSKKLPPTVKKQLENNKSIEKSMSQAVLPSDLLPKSDSTEKDQMSNQISTGTTAEVKTSSTQSTSQTSTATTQLASQMISIDAGVLGIKPVKVYSPKPNYPTLAYDLGISGTVKAILTIDTSGAVTDVTIGTSPHKSMSEEVIRTVLKWKFKPVEYKGTRVTIRKFVQELDFKTED